MTTITTDQRRTPLTAALALGAALVLGGALGAAWEQSHDHASAASTSHATTRAPFGGATTADEISGWTPGSRPGTGAPGGATTSQESTQ